jgi:hypothetical protein
MAAPAVSARSLASIVYGMTVVEAKARAGSHPLKFATWVAWGALTVAKWTYLGVLRAPARYFADRYELLAAAANAADAEGLVLEFGVFQGRSLNFLAKKMAPRPLHGFDSFEGLPTDWGPRPAGTFSLGGQLPPVEGNVTLHKGWFQETVPGFLAAHPGPVALLHVDCDLYESARYALDQVADRVVPGSVIVFDEFGGFFSAHEQQAFLEVVRARGWGTEYLGFTPWGSVAVRVLSTLRRE